MLTGDARPCACGRRLFCRQTEKKKKKATKLTVSQVEIGFDILKARDVAVAPTAETPPRSPSSDLSSHPACSTATTTTTTTTTAVAAVPPAATPPTTSNIVSDGNGGQPGDDKRKSYRLMVKRRLLKRHGEELSTDAPTRKRQLEELYREVEGGFLQLGAKLRGGGVKTRRRSSAPGDRGCDQL